MTTIKNIILFLFGIVLIVFGNKAAIDTIFKTDEGLKSPDLEEEKLETQKAVITEEVENKPIEEEIVSTAKVQERKKVEEVSKKETLKASENVPAKKIATEEPKISSVKKEVTVEEAPKTMIEPVQEESATASE